MQESLPLCTSCFYRVSPVGRYCFFCGSHDPLEPSCGCDLRPSGLNSLYALCRYQGEWREVLHRFKYRGQLNLAYPLGKALARSLLVFQVNEFPNLVVPVPLHPAREKERGFNQSLLMARHVARALRVPLKKVLSRSRNTVTQTHLSRKERQENVRGAFEIKKEFRLKGARVLLIDDIFTTGATMREAAKVLRRAGAAEVRGAVAAVQGPHRQVTT